VGSGVSLTVVGVGPIWFFLDRLTKRNRAGGLPFAVVLTLRLIAARAGNPDEGEQKEGDGEFHVATGAVTEPDVK
jgi:hypothetical protein